MLHPYNTQRARTINGHRQGSLKLGDILYIQDRVRPFTPTQHPTCRNPWQILAFLNDSCQDKFLARTHLVTVKSLRDGRTQNVAYWILERMDDEGLTKS
jgi:hypothetical protein